MSPLLAVAIATVAIGLTIRSARRGLGDRHTLEAHHRALDTLASMAAHRGIVRPGLADPPRSSAPPPDRSPGLTGPPRAGRPPVNRDPTARRPTPVRRRRAVPVPVVRAVGAAAVAALALALAVALLVGRKRPGSSRQTASHGAAAAAPAPPPSATPPPVVFGSGDAQEARFRVAPTRPNIELVAVSACWVQVRTASETGPVVFTATLHPGDRRPLPAAQAVWVRIGNPPGISIEVNRMPLAFTAPASSQPFNLVFEPTG